MKLLTLTTKPSLPITGPPQIYAGRLTSTTHNIGCLISQNPIRNLVNPSAKKRHQLTAKAPSSPQTTQLQQLTTKHPDSPEILSSN
jgi:hypothetical protein